MSYVHRFVLTCQDISGLLLFIDIYLSDFKLLDIYVNS